MTRMHSHSCRACCTALMLGSDLVATPMLPCDANKACVAARVKYAVSSGASEAPTAWTTASPSRCSAKSHDASSPLSSRPTARGLDHTTPGRMEPVVEPL